MENPINKLIETAIGEVGYLEKKSNAYLDDPTANAGRGNYTKYGRDMDKIPGFYNGGKNGYAWCAQFTHWCFVTCFGAEMTKRMLNIPDKSLAAGCKYAANYFKSVGRFFKTPERGDQIFFGTKDGATHTGIVYDTTINRVYTVEGNKGSSNKVALYSYDIADPSIYGYGRPNWDLLTDDPKKVTVLEWQKAAISDGFKFPKYGADGEWGSECEGVAKKAVVKKQLIGYKYPALTKIVQRVVGVSVDGKCGKDTKAAIIAWQKANGLDADGAVGINSWRKMLGV